MLPYISIHYELTFSVIPKEHTLFRMEVTPPKTSVEQHALKPLVFELSGDLLQTRAPDRANKKYKTHYQPDR